MENSKTMEYTIVDKPQFTVIGKRRRFSGDNPYTAVPEFWREFMSAADNKVCGMFGVCVELAGGAFDYYIADEYASGADIPDGYEAYTLPAGEWAVFPCRGRLPDALQSVNTDIWNDWLPNNKQYKLAGNYNVERYTDDENYSEIWLPVEKIDKK